MASTNSDSVSTAPQNIGENREELAAGQARCPVTGLSTAEAGQGNIDASAGKCPFASELNALANPRTKAESPGVCPYGLCNKKTASSGQQEGEVAVCPMGFGSGSSKPATAGSALTCTR